MNFMKSVLFGDQGVYKVFGYEVQFKEYEEDPNTNETMVSKIADEVFSHKLIKMSSLGFSHVLVHELGHAIANKLAFGSDSKIEVYTNTLGGCCQRNTSKGYTKEQAPPYYNSNFTSSHNLIQSISEEDRTEDNCLDSIKKSGVCLVSIPEQNRTKALCEAAVEESPHALVYVPDHLKTADMCTDAVKRFSQVIMYVPEHLITFDMAVSAVQRNYCLVANIPDRLKTQEFLEKAIYSNPLLSNYEDSNHIKIIKKLVPAGVFEQLKKIREKNKWKEAFVSYAGPMANLAYSGCKMMAAAALKDYIGLPLSSVLGAGGFFAFAGDTYYAVDSMIKNDIGDFGQIRRLGPKFLMAATASLATQCAMTALGTLHCMS